MTLCPGSRDPVLFSSVQILVDFERIPVGYSGTTAFEAREVE